MAQKFFGRGIDREGGPSLTHETRWHSTASVRRLLSANLRARVADTDVQADLLATLPDAFSGWTPLAQEQYLEQRTLLSPYILSSQGDRMLMAHSVEGRFPFLDPNVMRLAASLPDRYKLPVLDEKHILKRAAHGLVPEPILRRKKQAYRAPDALAFVAPEDATPDWVEAVLAEDAVRDAGVFTPGAVTSLWTKCRAHDESQLSNADNMSLIAVLSTQLIHEQFLRRAASVALPELATLIDRVAP
jgi:asparagine synthase (glutamine-hydrolysing)